MASIPSDPSPLMNQVRTMLSYAEDRNAKISIIKSILKKKQDHALPSYLPRDLILEAKVRFGNEKKSDTFRSVPSPIDDASGAADSSFRFPAIAASDAENCQNQILMGNEKKSDPFRSVSRPTSDASAADSSFRSASGPSIEASAAEIRQNQTLNVEKDLGRILSDEEIVGLKVSDVIDPSNTKILLIKDGSDPPP